MSIPTPTPRHLHAFVGLPFSHATVDAMKAGPLLVNSPGALRGFRPPSAFGWTKTTRKPSPPSTVG